MNNRVSWCMPCHVLCVFRSSFMDGGFPLKGEVIRGGEISTSGWGVRCPRDVDVPLLLACGKKTSNR